MNSNADHQDKRGIKFILMIFLNMPNGIRTKTPLGKSPLEPHLRDVRAREGKSSRRPLNTSSFLLAAGVNLSAGLSAATTKVGVGTSRFLSSARAVMECLSPRSLSQLALAFAGFSFMVPFKSGTPDATETTPAEIRDQVHALLGNFNIVHGDGRRQIPVRILEKVVKILLSAGSAADAVWILNLRSIEGEILDILMKDGQIDAMNGVDALSCARILFTILGARDPQLVINYYQRAIDSQHLGYSREMSARMELVGLFKKAGDPEKALALLAGSAERAAAEQDPAMHAGIMLTTGEILAGKGEYSKAFDAFRRAAELAFESASMFLYRTATARQLALKSSNGALLENQNIFAPPPDEELAAFVRLAETALALAKRADKSGLDPFVAAVKAKFGIKTAPKIGEALCSNRSEVSMHLSRGGLAPGQRRSLAFILSTYAPER